MANAAFVQSLLSEPWFSVASIFYEFLSSTWYKTIEGKSERLQLPLVTNRGQCYDVAGNIMGRKPPVLLSNFRKKIQKCLHFISSSRK